MIPNATTLDFSKGNHTHASVLKETKELQAKSLLSLERTLHLASECEATGATTLDKLGEQRRTLAKDEVATLQLQAKVDQGKKLQNEYAKWAFRFGTNRKAKKQTKQEKKLEAKINAVMKEEIKPPPTYKRLGPRPKKKAPVVVDDDPNRNELFSNHREATSRAERLDRNRNELFSNHRAQSNSPRAKAAPLTNQDERELEEIRANDDKLNGMLDSLGDQTKNLKELVIAMGREVEDHNERTDRIAKNLEKSKWETTQMNKRLVLLSKLKPVKEKKNKKGNVLRKLSPMARIEPASRA